MDNTNPRAAEEHHILNDGCTLRRFLDLFCNRWTSMRYPTTRDGLANGFWQFEIAQGDRKWVIGRLGNEYFRVREAVPVEIETLLRQLEAARSLLVLSPQPITELSEIKRTLLMTHQIN